MTRTCRAPGCQSPAASRYAVYCAHHKARWRRHGDTAQEAITAAALKPYIAGVNARIEKNRDNPAWGQLERRWQDVIDHAKRILATFEAGKPGNSHEMRAANEVRRIEGDAAPRDVVVTALALYVMLACEPRRFRSDAGFRFQLVRRVRALGDAHSGMSYDHASGKTRRIYRELPPKAVAIVGIWLAEAFGGAGVKLGQMELADTARHDDERQALRQALEDLK